MKRFWVFVIICVVALGIGFTVFRFMTREEILYVSQTVFEVNKGETKKIEIVKENLKSSHAPKAEIANTSVVEWVDEDTFTFKAKNGGTTTITFTSDLESFNPVTVQISVGDGNSSTPFYVQNKGDLASIGQTKVDEDGLTYIYPLSANYKLVADINDLAGDNWTPIAIADDAGFTGEFDFNGHTISNLTITSATGNYAGLFAKIGEGGRVKNANLTNTNISANVLYAGVVAGESYGRVEDATIYNANVVNSAANAYVGGIVGLNHGIITKSTLTNRASDYVVRASGAGSSAGGIAGGSIISSLNSNVYVNRCSSKTSVSGEAAVGGIVGKNIGSAIENCYAGSLTEDYIINSGVLTYVGGVVGLNTYADFGDNNRAVSYVADTYTAMKFGNVTSATAGVVIGENNNYSSGEDYNILYGNYYSNEIVPSLNGIGSDVNAKTSETAQTYQKSVADLKKKTTYFSYVDTANGGVSRYWQFEEGVWTINENNTLPELTFAISYVAPRYMNFVKPEAIRTANEFNTKLNPEDPSTFNAQMQYSLEDDITLKSSEGFVPFDFNGKLDGNGHTIYLQIDTPEGVVNGATGLFIKLGAGAKLTNLKVKVIINSILTADHIGGIAAYNNGGMLENCVVLENSVITTDKPSAAKMYIAGLVAENHGYIADSKSYATITYEKSPTLVYIGGIAAYTTNTIQNTSNYGKITAKNKSEAYVGGIAGYSVADTTSCANHGEIVGEVEALNAYYAGIVGWLDRNAESKISYSSSYEPITGSNVGGLVGISSGAIEFCYSSARLSGVYVGGLACKIKQGTAEHRSYIKNSMTDNSVLYGENSKAKVCGVVYQIDVSKSHLAYCEKIFSSSKFQGAGEWWYESYSNIRGLHIFGRQAVSAIDMDAFNNCIHVKRDDDSIVRNFGDFGWNPDDWLQWSPGWWQGNPDIPVTEDQAKGSDGYKAFTNNNFATTIWAFEEGNYPRIIGIAK